MMFIPALASLTSKLYRTLSPGRLVGTQYKILHAFKAFKIGSLKLLAYNKQHHDYLGF